MRFLLLVLALTATGMSSTPRPDRPARHPVDGPDVDVRVQVLERAVKMQIIMNLAYVDEIVDTPREDEFAIQAAEHAGIRETLFDFYKKSNKVVVDGVEVAALDQGFEAFKGDEAMLPLFPRMMEKALWRVQLSLEYPCKARPSRVSFTWGEFPINPVLATATDKPRIEIRANLIAKGVDEIVDLNHEEPEYTWHDSGESVEKRFLAVPEPPKPDPLRLSVITAVLGLIGLVLLGAIARTAFSAARRAEFGRRAMRLGAVLVMCSGAAFFTRDLAVVELPNPFDATPPLPSVAQAAEIFAPLHRNIYRAFDYVEEGEVYDALARSVAGELLDDLYNQVYRSLIMHEEGGAVSRVSAVRAVSTEVESVGLIATHADRPGFQVHAKWQVDGVVRHWNHAHYRTNEYEARYTVVQNEKGWRIAGHEVLSQKRIDDGSDVPPDQRGSAKDK